MPRCGQRLSTLDRRSRSKPQPGLPSSTKACSCCSHRRGS
ncbi:hypothetical protein GN958_ATG15884 [Phytophthora infestans]|uniref:Uncharacterized protein n=1 Tax=Phytophthora infestans TaxID=4787 RepID=A0A8S9U1F7_PHYIN|nr:hypothetical protein GN958_ATG15884 [Phytophthora infestans]